MNKLIIIASAFLLMITNGVNAQTKYFTRNGNVKFISKTPLEEIEGINKKAAGVLDTETGIMEFSVLMKAFEFEKSLMQEHFNENYVESDKYPKAGFKGAIVNPTDVKWAIDGTYPVKVKGKMTMHDVTNDLLIDGSITVKDGKIMASSSFLLPVKEYKIEIPKVVKDKVSENVKVDVEMNFEALKSR